MIGTGWMGRAIAPDLTAHPGFELVAVAGRNAERTAEYAALHNVQRALTAEQLIADPDLDLVYITTPHDSHLEYALAAIAAGRPVLVEKPLTVNAPEAERLFDAARDRGVFAMEALWSRFNPVVRRVTELIGQGAIGEPRTVQASFGFPVPPGDHRLWDAARAGGSLLDQGVYPLTLADLVLGEPETVAATGSRLGYDGADAGVDTELGMLLGYPGGRQAVLATSIRSVLPLDASIGGERGRIAIDPPFWSTTALSVIAPDGTTERFEHPFDGNGYRPMLDAVQEALEAGWLEHPLCDHASTLRVMRTIDRVAAALER
jgi:predicted dehydrogenase